MYSCVASDPAENPYWKRDVRRAYPQLSVVTQEELATFLLQSPEQPAYVKYIISAYNDAKCISLTFTIIHIIVSQHPAKV